MLPVGDIGGGLAAGADSRLMLTSDESDRGATRVLDLARKN